MSDRLNAMFNHVDAFIALPGGLGTLEEIFHIFSWAHLHIHHKPISLLNVNDFSEYFLKYLGLQTLVLLALDSAHMLI